MAVPAKKEPPRLLPEIWDMVIQYLRRPLPPPNGKNERSSIRQPDLASAMRVCKLFNVLAARPLYSICVCDDIPALLERVGKPAAARGIPDKAILLSYIDRLFLEYCSKSDPSYATILRYGKPSFGLIQPSWDTTLGFCYQEAEWLVEGLAKLFRTMTEGLSTLSTGAFLGGQKDIWERVWNIPEGHPYFMANKITRARENLTDLLHFPGAKPPVFCSGVEFGPLTFISTIWNNAGAGTPGHSYRAHCNSELGVTPAIIGGNARWYFTFEDREAVEDAIMMIGKAVGQLVWAREGLRQGLITNPTAKVANAAASSLSVDFYLPPEFLRYNCLMPFKLKINEIISVVCRRHEIDPSRGAGDIFNYKALADAPPCEACSWTINDRTTQRMRSTLPNLDFDKINIGEVSTNDIYNNWRPAYGETVLHTMRPASETKSVPGRGKEYFKPKIHYVPTLD